MMFAVSAVMMTSSVFSCQAKGKDKEKPQIKTYEEAVARFNSVFGVEAGWDKPFEVYPDNRFYVDVMNQQLCFVHNGKKDTTKWSYTPATGTLKHVKEQEQLKAWIKSSFHLESDDLTCLFNEIDAEDKYKDNILKAAGMTDADKVFSLIYNSLVGDGPGYLAAYLNKEGVWTKVRHEDYATRTLDKERFIEAVASIDGGLAEGTGAYQFLVDNKVLGRAEVFKYCYWNFRQDKYYVYPKATYKMATTDDLDVTMAPEIKPFRSQILSNPDKVYVMMPSGSEIRDLDSFYKDPQVCLELDVDYLSKCRYASNVEKKEETDWTLLILIVCGAVILCAGGVLVFIFRKRIGGMFRKKAPKKTEKVEKVEDVKPVVEEKPHHDDGPMEAFIASLKKIAESERPSAEAVLKAYDRFFKTKTKDTFQNLLNEKADLLAGMSAFTAFSAKVKDGKAALGTLLHEVDVLFQDNKTKYQEVYNAEIASMGNYANLYHAFIHLTNESAVMEAMDAIRKQVETFPEVKTVARLVKKAKKKSADVPEQICAVLQEADPSMLASYESCCQDAEAYARIGGMLRHNDMGMSHDRYLQSLVDNALAMDDMLTVDKYIDFALKFKASGESADAQLTSVASAAREKYAQIEAAYEGLLDASADLMSKETMNYWDRLSYFLVLAAASDRLFKAGGRDFSDKIGVAVEAFKNDILYLYMTRNFVIASKDPSVEADYFEHEVLGGKVAAKVNDFNAACPEGGKLDMDDETIRGCIKQCVEAVRKIRKEEAMTETFALMWDRFVKDFIEKVSANRDKGWLIGNSLQIAIYLADVLRYVVGGSEEYYCSNYSYLRKGELADCDKDFIHNDYRYSDEYSNFIYALLQEMGSADIDMIVNNFRIKM